MSLDFAERHPEARAVFEEADDALALPLSRWVAEGDVEHLRRTEVAQPAILTASLAVFRAVEPRLPKEIRFFAGHSLGEYAALVAAGALELADAVRLVRRRGQLMQQAVPEGHGAMAAVIGLSGDDVARVCAAIAAPVAPANFNSPVQTVIAGSAEAVAKACAELEKAGAKRIVPLEVSAPFHCELMQPAMQALTAPLADTPFSNARVPVISNVTAEPYVDPETARKLLREQVCAPVRWVGCVERMKAGGARVQLEVGPGSVLSGLVARIDRALVRAHISELGDVETALERIAEAGA